MDKGIQQNMSSYPLPNINMLNFRNQSAVTLTSDQKLVNGKQETYYNLKNNNGYTAKYVTPPCVTEYAHLRAGGNYNRTPYSQTTNTSSISANMLKSGAGGVEEDFAEERNDFWTHMQNTVDSALKQMYDMDILGGATAARKKAAKYYKNKTPEEQETKAFQNFKKAAMIPMKKKEDSNGVPYEFIAIKCRSHNKDGSERQVRFMQESGGKYVEMEDTPEIHSGALVSLVFTLNPFIMSKDKYGISFRLVPDIVVFTTGEPRGSSIPAEVIDTPNRAYDFATVEGKNGRLRINTSDQEGRKLITRIAPSEVLFSDLKNGTLGKFSGVTASTAKLNAVLKENPAEPASVAQFDYLQKMVEDGIQYVLKDDKLMAKAKAELKESAEEMAAESGEPFDATYRGMVDDIFNNPIGKREEDEYRTLKITQRMFPYGEEEKQNVIPLQDADGNDVTDTCEIRRGAKIAPVLSPSFYFMPDGNFGMKFEVTLREGIRVLENPDGNEGAGSNGILYSFDKASKKRSADTDDEPSAKRVKTN